MGIKKFRPMTPGTRTRSILDNEVITRKGPEKSLTESMSSSGGRNHHGRITSRRRGGGHKRRYRKIDFKRNKFDVPGKVAHIEYDPNRSANIALIHYADGEKRYIIHPKGLNVGDTITSGPNADVRLGCALPLELIPLGTVVHCVELKAKKGAQMARSAGAGVQVMRPAAPGTGVIAGGPVRAVLEAAGVTDVLTKSLGTNNPINVVRATMNGLEELVTAEQAAEERGVPVEALGVHRG